MSIPELSHLNWSSERPTFEEVKGKMIVFTYKIKHFKFPNVVYGVREINDEDVYEFVFDDDFPNYAIIDATPPDPEPLPLWGVMPEIHQIDDADWEWVWKTENESFRACGFDTRAEAVNNWNITANALENVKDEVMG